MGVLDGLRRPEIMMSVAHSDSSPAFTDDEVRASAAALPLPEHLKTFRRFPMDDALLLFDRDTGWNALLDGAETAGRIRSYTLRMRYTAMVSGTCMQVVLA